MKSKIYFFLFLTSLFCTSMNAVANVNDETTANDKAVSTQNATEKSQKANDEVIAWLIVLNLNEINSANAVLRKNVDGPIKSYARMMDKDHTRNLEKTRSLGHDLSVKPIKDSKTRSLEKKGQNELYKLAKLDDQKLGNAYINAMIKDHTEALSELQKQIKANRVSPELKDHLQSTRDAVAQHLEDAKKLRDEMHKQAE